MSKPRSGPILEPTKFERPLRRPYSSNPKVINKLIDNQILVA